MTATTTTQTPVRSPRRLQVTRGTLQPLSAVYVGPGTRWAPHHTITRCRCGRAHDRADVLIRYRHALADNAQLVAQAVDLLAGRDLICLCGPRLACHADLLLVVANGGEM